MKNILLCITFIILTGISGVAPQTEPDAAFDGEIVRLHVIANSNSEADQKLKLKVRNAVLHAAEGDISSAKDIEGLNAAVKNRLDILKSAAENTLRRENSDYPVSVQFGVFPFPAKTYGNVTFPAGDYNAVKVIIGSGEGNNWWCVLFPPLCFTDETYANMPDSSISSLSDETADRITKPKFKAKFKIAEILQNHT